MSPASGFQTRLRTSICACQELAWTAADSPGHACVRCWNHQPYTPHPRFHLHFTPTSSSWINLVERWFAELTNRKLRRSAHRSVTELETDIRKWITEWNKNPRPFVWTKTADEILESLAAYCQRI